jgi:hypothetical protein
MKPPCDSYCEHGGVCELYAGHEGLHDSSYCQWDDAHAVSKEQADAELRRKNPGGYGDALVVLSDIAKGIPTAFADEDPS